MNENTVKIYYLTDLVGGGFALDVFEARMTEKSYIVINSFARSRISIDDPLVFTDCQAALDEYKRRMSIKAEKYLTAANKFIDDVNRAELYFSAREESFALKRNQKGGIK